MIKILRESFVDVFKEDKTGVSFYDDFLDPKEQDYLKFNKAAVGKIVKMTCDEYFQMISERVFNKSVSQCKRGLSVENINKYAEMMKDGVRFNLPYINLHPYFGPSQEGRHRMMAMSKAFGKDTEGSVLIVEPYEPSQEEIEEYALKKYGPRMAGWGEEYIKSVLDKYLSE